MKKFYSILAMLTLTLTSLLAQTPEAQTSDPVHEVVMHRVYNPDNQTAAYYASYYSGDDRNFVLPDHVSAYAGYFGTDGWHMFTAYYSGKVFGKDPVVLYIHQDDINSDNGQLSDDRSTFTIQLQATSEKPQSRAKPWKEETTGDHNELLGTLVPTDLTQDADSKDYYYYALQLHHTAGAATCLNRQGKENETCPHIGLFWLNANGAPFTNGAMKAYLRAPKIRFVTQEARMQGFSFDEFIGTETIVRAIEQARQDASACYDLQGRRQEKPAAEGIYIRNGKKYIAR